MDFGNISDYEFEALAAEVVGELEGVALSCYAPGPDGGIDASNSVAYRTGDGKAVVVQAKRYISTPASKIVNDARKLAGQISASGDVPDVLYLVTSAEMSKAKIDEAIKLLSGCCKDARILHKRDLVAFLSEEQNRRILRNHVGLWMPDAAVLQEALVQDCAIDGQMLIDTIASHQGRYQATSMLNQAINICDDNGVCLIVGPPGIGKTFLSHLVIAHYVEAGYRLSYTTANDVASVKRSMSMDSDVREVCLMDDFLGQRYYQMSESRPTEIAALIRYVQRSRCGNGHRKVIVLNSRLTILNEARRLNSPFCQWLDEHGMDATMMLDASKLTRRDKSVLLCCQLSASGVKAQHIRQMIDGRAFKRVVDSPDFNPRVLERVCKLAAEDRVPADRFVDEVSEAMSRPLMVWTDEYENHMQAEDRTLLNVLFSLSDGSVESEILKQCYDSRIGSIASVDSTRPSFEACVDRLNDSMLQIIAGPPRRLGVHNPSINDFLQATLESNPVEVRCLIRSSIYSDQILRLARVCDDDAIAELVDEALSGGAILSMPWVGVDAGTCYLKLAKSRDWKPCDSASLSKATAMCMERSRDHDPVFDLLEDVEYGFIPEVVADEVLPVILDDSRIRLVLEKWPDDKIPRYFDLARKYRPEESKTFSDAFGKWLAGRVDDAIEESVWSRAHDAREEFVECDEDGNAYIPESAEDECVSLLLSDAKQDALSTLEQLFSGHEEVLDWLDVDVWGFILEFSTSVDCLSIVEQTIGWESSDHHDKSNPDISDEEIERALGSLVNDFGSKR